MTPEEQIVVDFLTESLGLNFEILDAIKDQKTPDFLIAYEGKKYLLELKSSFESDEAIQAKKTAYEQDKIYQKSVEIRPTNKNSRNFNNAYKQLQNRKESESANYCLYIINLMNTDGSYQEQTVFSNLFGVANILTEKGIYDCLYYFESEFYKRKSLIDGAIIVKRNSSPILMINDHSVNYESFKASGFVKLFDAICDPVVLESTSEKLSIREGIDRKDRTALRSHLQEKYGFEYAIEVPMTNSYASVKVDK